MPTQSPSEPPRFPPAPPPGGDQTGTPRSARFARGDRSVERSILRTSPTDPIVRFQNCQTRAMANGDAGHQPQTDGADAGGGSPGAPVWDGSAWVVPGTPWMWDGVQWVDRAATPPPAPPPPPPPPPPSAAGTPAPTGHPRSSSPAPVAAASPWAGPAFPVGGASAAPPVSRGAVFGHVLWRVAVVCVVGGAAVGFLFVLVLLAFPDDGDRAFSFLPVGSLVGGILGAMLAVVAAPTIAGVCAGVLVPYRGRAKTLLTVRLLAMGLVALFLLLLLSGAVLDVGVIVALAGLTAASLAGAWFGSSWVIGWYVRRCEGAN